MGVLGAATCALGLGLVVEGDQGGLKDGVLVLEGTGWWRLLAAGSWPAAAAGRYLPSADADR